jgi:hypothetical protein
MTGNGSEFFAMLQVLLSVDKDERRNWIVQLIFDLDESEASEEAKVKALGIILMLQDEVIKVNSGGKLEYDYAELKANAKYAELRAFLSRLTGRLDE